MKRAFYILLLFISITTHAETETLTAPLLQYPSFEAPQADWIFSGIVQNERGETFHYYFELQKNNKNFQAIASVTEGASKHLILYEKTEAFIETSPATQWQVGRIFLTFNPITNTWLFGVQNQDNKGFQFKVDMLSQTNALSPKPKELRPGIKFTMQQAGLLHGYLQTGAHDKEDFVTAAKSWFQQVWVTEPQTLEHTLIGVLCEFNNGNSFYAMHLKESDAIHGAIAGWRNEQGESTPISQFITIGAEHEHNWTIDLSAPKLHLDIENLVDKKPVVIGISDKLPGFCTMSEHVIAG